MKDQSATLQRALDALDSICLKPPGRTERGPGCEPTKALVASTNPEVLERATGVDGTPPDDPADWRKPFARWLGSACVRNLRCSGGVGCLHVAFCEWAIAQDDVPCKRFTFECLLREVGLEIDEIAGVVLVTGLTFAEDAEAAGL